MNFQKTGKLLANHINKKNAFFISKVASESSGDSLSTNTVKKEIINLMEELGFLELADENFCSLL